MSIKTLPILTLVASLMAASAVHAQVYSWTDAQGSRHYGDASTAPLDRARIVGTATPPASPSPSPGLQPGPSDASPASVDPSCQQATANHALLADKSKRVLKPGKDGAVEMTQAERASATELAQQQVKMYCAGS